MLKIKQIISKLKTIKNYDPEYLGKYVDFLLEDRIYPDGTHLEKHHILPESLFPEYRKKSIHPWNFKKISGADHVQAHLLLFRAFPDNSSMAHAYRQMVGRFDINTDPEVYNEARKIVSEALRKRATGIKQSPETIAKRVAKTTGQKRTHEQIETMKLAMTGVPKSVPMTKEHKEKLSLAKKGVPKPPGHGSKVSASSKGKKKSPEHIKNNRLARLGKKRFMDSYGMKYFIYPDDPKITDLSLVPIPGAKFKQMRNKETGEIESFDMNEAIPDGWAGLVAGRRHLINKETGDHRFFTPEDQEQHSGLYIKISEYNRINNPEKKFRSAKTTNESL